MEGIKSIFGRWRVGWLKRCQKNDFWKSERRKKLSHYLFVSRPNVGEIATHSVTWVRPNNRKSFSCTHRIIFKAKQTTTKWQTMEPEHRHLEKHKKYRLWQQLPCWTYKNNLIPCKWKCCEHIKFIWSKKHIL